jgi:glutathionylspermidine synthase
VKRRSIEPRLNWEAKVEEYGMVFHHHPDGALYWNESAYYELDEPEVDQLEDATNELAEMCLNAVERIISENRFAGFNLPFKAVELIEWSWKQKRPSIYGRFDFAYDGGNRPKLLEYNADTPTSLLESSVIQWFWLKDKFPHDDQFNSIHEGLIERWKQTRSQFMVPVHFAYAEDETGEDLMTVTYLRETAEEVGLLTKDIKMQDVGWDQGLNTFVNTDGDAIRSIFKLYPWEWMVAEDFGLHALDKYADIVWIEPIWKMLLSNKQILSVLWELYPNHPNLLPTYSDGPRNMKEYVCKPVLAREGANITVVSDSGTIKTGGNYSTAFCVYQQLAKIRDFDGFYPTVGSWVIGGESAGVGIRESTNIITDNRSQFVPHVLR